MNTPEDNDSDGLSRYEQEAEFWEAVNSQCGHQQQYCGQCKRPAPEAYQSKGWGYNAGGNDGRPWLLFLCPRCTHEFIKPADDTTEF